MRCQFVLDKALLELLVIIYCCIVSYLLSRIFPFPFLQSLLSKCLHKLQNVLPILGLTLNPRESIINDAMRPAQCSLAVVIKSVDRESCQSPAMSPVTPITKYPHTASHSVSTSQCESMATKIFNIWATSVAWAI